MTISLHVQFKLSKDHFSTGLLEEPLQILLFNLVDGCYGMLKDLEYQIAGSDNHQDQGIHDRRDSLYSKERLSEWEKALNRYANGLSALNTSFARCVPQFQ